MESENIYLDTETAAAVLDVSRQWLEIGRIKGYGPPFIKIGSGNGGIVRYRRSTLDQWLAARERTQLGEGE